MYFSFGLTLSLVCPALRVYHRSLGHLCRCWTDPCLCRVLLVQLLNSESDVGPLNWNVLVMELTSQGNCKNTRRETRVNHSSSSSLLGAASAASRAFRALDISLAPSFSAPSRLPRADRFQSLMDDDEGGEWPLTDEGVYRLFCLPFKRLEFLLQVTLQIPICAFGGDIQQVLSNGSHSIWQWVEEGGGRGQICRG